MVKMAVRGTPCVCKDRQGVKSTLINCMSSASLSSCSGLTSSHKRSIEASSTNLQSILDGVDCSSITTGNTLLNTHSYTHTYQDGIS